MFWAFKFLVHEFKVQSKPAPHGVRIPRLRKTLIPYAKVFEITKKVGCKGIGFLCLSYTVKVF